MSDRDVPDDGVTVLRDAWSDRSPSAAIAAAIAAATGCDSTDLPALFESVDPDALNHLLLSDGDIHVTFVHAGTEVDAWSDGTITVEPR
jgi:hypothetical protein